MRQDTKPEIVRRLRSIEGHVRGVERMVQDDAYCMDLLQQTNAIQRALEKINAMILADHMQTCVTTAIRGDSPEDRERVIGELLQVFEAQRKA